MGTMPIPNSAPTTRQPNAFMPNAECARRAHKGSELEAFIKNLRGREMPIAEFDAVLWMSMVKRVMVEVDGSIRFTFANEMEIIV